MANPVPRFPIPRNNDEAENLSLQLDIAHTDFIETAKRSRIPAAIMTILLLGALIVMGSACACLGLPGVNVIHNVILPGILPGGCAILLSIPFIIKTVKIGRQKTAIYENRVFPLTKAILKSPLLDDARRLPILYVESHILVSYNPRDYADYYRTLLTKASKYFSEGKKRDNNPDNSGYYERRTKAITGVMTNLLPPRKKKKI